ncbi:CAP domain-containing protein [Pelagibacterium xiamenense]|uniref:CAP domain-containing protein n=1 Tax=Pelagibacterium xiamenense TaxID=2901140 RepID=UPI001E5CC1CD|nr:CAP domain-containing protein [Pelagibacterium xiamenense]MCD7058607.1 CAP domain-containing protein [Pelagibacterium xiamenense]
MTDPTRRRFLLISSGFAATALAGCASSYVMTTPRATPVSYVSPSAAQAALNAMRRDEDLPEVSHNATLQAVADEQAAIMARTGNVAHTAESGEAFITRLRRQNFWGGAGENLAGGPPTLEAVIDGWMTSPTHHRVMVNPDYRQFGLAVRRGPSTANNSYGTYWALVMGVTPPAWAQV